MGLERIYTPGLAQVAYLVGDEEAGIAAVIDPRRDIDAYLNLARAKGLRVTHIFETHIHADFVSGAPELAAATGATIYASRRGEEAFPHEPLDDGDVVEVGALRIAALWTPGHTPEHLSYLLTDPALGNRPQALFSGDMLFVGDVGRPDLLGEAHTTQLVEQLFSSVRGKLMPLADDLIVYPAHTAGSACGKSIGDAPSTTIGQEKRFNYAFQLTDLDQFREAIMQGMPPSPTYYPVLKQVNKAGAPLLKTLEEPRPLDPGAVAEHAASGALMVDTRSPAAFGDAHVPSSIFVGLGPNFAVWMGWLAPYDKDLVLILEDDSRLDEALTELRRIGLDRVAGYLRGGLPAWVSDGREIATLPQVSVRELRERLTRDARAPHVLDVRSADEWRAGHIAGASHHYLADIIHDEDAATHVPADGAIATICGTGYRASVAASLLERAGRHNLVNVIGGMEAWNAAGLETVSEPADAGS